MRTSRVRQTSVTSASGMTSVMRKEFAGLDESIQSAWRFAHDLTPIFGEFQARAHGTGDAAGPCRW